MFGKSAVEGDSTDHGGSICKVSGNLMINGKIAARKGDTVTCPIHGDNQLTECSGMSVNGMALALHGDKSACGSTVIASSVLSFNL